MLKIITVPNQILRTPVKPISVVDKKIKNIIKEMTQTLVSLKDPPGVGLAAPQVGLNLSLFVFKNGKKISAVVNPKLISHSDEEVLDIRKKHTMLEGCLSIPYYYGTVKRFSIVTISYLDENGRALTQTFNMPEAVIIQHEMDHLEGKLFIDKLLKQKGRLYKIDKGSNKEEMEEIEI
ncbi:MAG: peptide deformylase [Patescibacteria group bacterium]|nr:peptide deformylase [Patescibacteria group bacterium]